VVSTDVGGVPYLIDHQADGLLVPAQQPLAMAEEVLRLIDTPELARCLSEHARTEARQFDWSVVVPQWQKLLTALTESGARAAEACHVRS
jgi:glycosyltransferase involved in cell wall biosynthesis